MRGIIDLKIERTRQLRQGHKSKDDIVRFLIQAKFFRVVKIEHCEPPILIIRNIIPYSDMLLV